MESLPAIRQLNQITGQILALSPGDFQELAHVVREIEEWSGPDACSDAHRERAREAIGRIEQIILQEVEDPEAALAEVAAILGELQEGIDDDGGGNIAEDSSAGAVEATLATGQVSDALPQTLTHRPSQKPAGDETPDEKARNALPEDADPDLLGEFITESREYIENAEAALLSLETSPDDAEAVNTIFRAFHTIKGTSAFLGLMRLSDLAHHAESLLSRVRDNEIRCTGGYADLALRSVDILKDLIQQVQDALGGEPMGKPGGYDELIELLADPEAAGVSDETDPLRVGDILVAEGKAEREEIEAAAACQGRRPIGEAIVRSEVAPVADVAKAIRTQQTLSGAGRAGESSVRVRTDRLDNLGNLVGELVITQSMVAQDLEAATQADQRLGRNMNQLAKITRELQEVSMLMRMVPVKGVFQKMARLVRDLARKAGKEIDFVTSGSETELDRNVVEQIGDPLVHMMRNAVDHGIEIPDEREAAGKPRKGRVELRAFHRAGSVVIEIEDDGKGLDRERILKKAVSGGLLREGQDLADQEAYRLIFNAGLSTAEKVTNVSGRGVGMDVVRKNIESLRGRVDINSTPGKGSIFTIRMPLTLAVIDGQLVTVGKERYVIPTTSIERCLRPAAEQMTTVQGRGEMVTVRGSLLPMFRLYELFGIEPRTEDPTDSLVVIVENNGDRCCLMVDELLGQQQVVIKSLGSGLGEVKGVSGGAIMGDGNVSLILDVPGLIELATKD